MRLVADENCDFSVVAAVRAAGHDVVSIMEAMSGVDDEKVIAVATGTSVCCSRRIRTSGSSCLLPPKRILGSS